MIGRALAAACAAFVVLACQGPAAAEGSDVLPERLDWTISPGGSGRDDQVQLSLSYRTANSESNWSSTTNLADLQGLDPAQLAASSGTDIRFRIVRDAGRFDCEGVVRRRRGTGDCRFEGDAAFAEALADRGIGRPTPSQQFSLALARVGRDLVEELERQRYARPSVEDLVRAGIHGVSADYVRAMAASGYRVGEVDGLVQMRIHGVTPDYVRALAEAGYRPDLEMVRRLAIHGVSTDFIREMGALGYTDLDAEQLVSLRIHDVSPSYIRALRELGYEGLSPEQLRRMRIHGVTPEFVRARAASRPSPEELIRMRIHGA